MPEELARELARQGFFRIFLPEAYGGLDLAPTQGLEVLEELARFDASVAWCVWNGNTHWIAAQLSPEAARAVHAKAEVITANSTRASGVAESRLRRLSRERPMVACQRLRAQRLDGAALHRP